MLEHLNDRRHAVEKDPRSPCGQGYTGFEAPLQWLYDQSMAINTYDKNGYILKINLFTSKCSDYQNPKSLKEEMAKDPSFYKDCAAILGPNQPAITTPDPTSTGKQFAATENHAPANKKSESKEKPPAEQVSDKLPKTDEKKPAAQKDPVKEIDEKLPAKELRKRAIERIKKALEKGTGDVQKLRERLEDRLGIQLPKLEDIRKQLPPAPSNPQAPTPTFPQPQVPSPNVPNLPTPKLPTDDITGPLLDYLFAP